MPIFGGDSMSISDIFEVDTGEDCICKHCGEEKYLQFGICMICGGNVIDKGDQQ
jgi:hypothetical protein